MLNLLRNLHLDPYEREAWLDDYVQTGLKHLFQTPTAFLDLTATQVEHDVVSFSNIILKSLANLLSNEGALSHKDGVATPEPAAIEAEPNHDEPLREQLLPEDEPVLVEADIHNDELNDDIKVEEPIEQPVPTEVEREPSPAVEPVPEPEPEPEEPIPDDSVPEPVPNLSYSNTPELRAVEPEPEPEQTRTAASWWDWSVDAANKPKKEDVWPITDEPASALQEPVVESVPEPEPQAAPEEPAIEYPEPVATRDFSQVLEHQPPVTPDNNDTAPAAAVPSTETPEPVVKPVEAAVERIKSKKRLSLFRSATEPADKTPDSQSLSSRVQTPEPKVEDNKDTKDSKLETAKDTVKGAVDDAAAALLSSASSASATASPKKTKKKKKSLFYRSDVL